jgi:sec-independent protein translocase protein TatB
MFEVGWSEMLVIAVVMIVIVGPKDLPAMLRTFGRTVAKLRGMAGDFQKQFNDALKEAELDDVKKSVDSLRGLNPMTEIRKQLNPFEKAASDVRAGIDNVMKPKPAADPSAPAAAETTAAEPLKNGPAELPVSDAPASTPAFPAMTDSSVVAEAAARPARKTASKKATKAAAPKAAVAESAKAVPARPARAKASPAKAAPVKTAAKTAPAAGKPVSTNRKPAEKPAPTNKKVAEKPAATKKKTAGTAK